MSQQAVILQQPKRHEGSLTPVDQPTNHFNGTITDQDLIRSIVEGPADAPVKAKQKQARSTSNQWFDDQQSVRPNSESGDRLSQVSKSFNEYYFPPTKGGGENIIKLYQRIWSGYTKFMRSQCNKDRLVDSLYFGSFYRKELQIANSPELGFDTTKKEQESKP